MIASVVITDSSAQPNNRQRIASSRRRSHEKARRSDGFSRRDRPALDTGQSPQKRVNQEQIPLVSGTTT